VLEVVTNNCYRMWVQKLHSLLYRTNDCRRRTMKDKMFGRPIVELPPIHPVKQNSKSASALFLLTKVLRTRNTLLSRKKRELYTAFSKTVSVLL